MNERVLFVMLTGFFAVCGAFVVSGGCQRTANILDDPDESAIDKPPDVDAGVLPLVDSGLESDAFLACSDRPTGECVGSNDFLCAFEKWMIATAKSCQLSTGCKTSGWLDVKMGFEGCVHEIRMEQPNDEMVACLVAEFGAVRCPCGEIQGSYFFGNANDGGCDSP